MPSGQDLVIQVMCEIRGPESMPGSASDGRDTTEESVPVRGTESTLFMALLDSASDIRACKHVFSFRICLR